jgi:hypothetical protein
LKVIFQLKNVVVARRKTLSSDTQRLRVSALDIYPALKSGRVHALLLQVNISPIAHKIMRRKYEKSVIGGA